MGRARGQSSSIGVAGFDALRGRRPVQSWAQVAASRDQELRDARRHHPDLLIALDGGSPEAFEKACEGYSYYQLLAEGYDDESDGNYYAEKVGELPERQTSDALLAGITTYVMRDTAPTLDRFREQTFTRLLDAPDPQAGIERSDEDAQAVRSAVRNALVVYGAPGRTGGQLVEPVFRAALMTRVDRLGDEMATAFFEFCREDILNELLPHATAQRIDDAASDIPGRQSAIETFEQHYGEFVGRYLRMEAGLPAGLPDWKSSGELSRDRLAQVVAQLTEEYIRDSAPDA